MRSIETLPCHKCNNVEPSESWGLLDGRPKLLVVLESSDPREVGGYEQALWQTRTGRRLLTILQGDTREVAIVNAIKCLKRFGDHVPPQMIRNCRRNLITQIEELNPDGILLVGGIARAMFFADNRLIGNQPILTIDHLRIATTQEVQLAENFASAIRNKA